MNRTIAVKGTGKISKAPDQICLKMSLSKTGMEYSDVDAAANLAISQIAEAVKAAGLDEKELRTHSYRLDASYHMNNANGDYKQIFDGYEYSIDMELCFPLNMKLLGAVLHNISECQAKPELHISFDLADQDAAKDEMLIAATKDAKKKAEILAQAANVTLGQLITIQYDWSEVRLQSESSCDYLSDVLFTAAPSGVTDITPEDVKKTDTAVFVWEII